MPNWFEVDRDGLAQILDGQLTSGHLVVREYAKALASKFLDIPELRVAFYRVPNNFSAAFCKSAGSLDFNLRRLPGYFFDGGATQRVNELLIREFAHYFSQGHLSSDYHDALCRLGAALTRLALEKPEFFKKYQLV